ncbi:hypothetical protein SADUNF_Sadunf07G0118300 [Salix dunnii]|uniref:Bifunctional inhibitor/plant lipid transfer protein/seed storage helical domain-containing protein n=1 Tax=Salix dunnii TaxID=1413687 RepID=A0A835JXD9_9ROSI|nr:hypothetical protein SADUNF_Sadunf07G0118300 [Salix dunnii]
MLNSCTTKKFEPENPTIHYDIGYERQHLPWFSTNVSLPCFIFDRLFPYSQDHPRLGNYGTSIKNVMLRVYSGSIRRNKSPKFSQASTTLLNIVLLKAELMARIVGFLIFAISAQAMAKFDVDPDQCQVIFDNFPYCMDFLIGSNDWPSRQCCQRVYDFNALAKHGMGPRAICECIEIITVTIPMKLRVDRISDLPVRCNTHLSFPISEYMDCNR